jgi:simple sugar transport system ATP-binding protein
VTTTPTNSDNADSIIEMSDVGKFYGNIRALSGVNLTVRQGEVTCILGDNGAGKSTLIKIVSGLHPHDEGVFRVDGKEVSFASPREALSAGISTVYQDLALVPLMPVWRNFFLGSELTKGFWPFRRLDTARMRRIANEELTKMGIELSDVDQPVGTLSGGQMQVVSIARAIHFGARVLILDEPTAALGVKQSGVLNLGNMELDAKRADLTLENLTQHMAGGAALDALKHEMRETEAPDLGAVHSAHEAAHELAETS